MPTYCKNFCCFETNEVGVGWVKYNTPESAEIGVSKRWKISVEKFNGETFSCTKTVAGEGNYWVTISCEGNGIIAVDENLEKGLEYYMNGGIIEDFDPLLRWYIKLEGSTVRTLYRVISSDLPLTTSRIRLATCDVGVANLRVETTFKGTGYAVFGSFQVYDGERPVYIPDIEVKIGKKVLRPSFIENEKKYQFLVEVPPGSYVLTIEGDVDGCGEIGATKRIDLPVLPLPVLLFVALLVVALLFLWKKRPKS